MRQRRIMRERKERLHPGDVAVFWFAMLGFLFLFVRSFWIDG